MKQPENRISVVINTRNAAQHLEQVLRSVQGFDATWKAPPRP